MDIQYFFWIVCFLNAILKVGVAKICIIIIRNFYVHIKGLNLSVFGISICSQKDANCPFKIFWNEADSIL